MIFGIAEIVLLGLLFEWLFRSCKLPGLIGLLFFGMAIGPYCFNMVNQATYQVSYDLRMFALVVILLRAGFELSKEALAQVGMRAILMSFIPCITEVFCITMVAPLLLPLTRMEAAMLGGVLAAVSPAVVVPLMIQMIEKGRGVDKGVPTLVLAGASCDDAVAIVLCTSFIGMYVGKAVSLSRSLLSVPVSVITGISLGLLVGLLLFWFFKKTNPRATKRVLIIVGLAVFMVVLQKRIESFVPFAALLAVMAIGFVILEKSEGMAHEISSKLGKIWIFAQLLLFTLVGAQVNIPVAVAAGLGGVAVVFVGLAGRSIGVQLCLLRSNFSMKERLFITIAYLPKATVQAAIGGAPLAAMAAAGMSTVPGELILAVAVMSILLTAPAGAILISWSSRFLLTCSDPTEHLRPSQVAADQSR